jgi:hypothetical protein
MCSGVRMAGCRPADHPEAADTYLPGQAGIGPLRDAGGVATTGRDASTSQPPILPRGCPLGFQVGKECSVPC